VVEEAVGVDLAHGLLDGLGAKGAADLLEGEELVGGRVLDEVDVGEAALDDTSVSSHVSLKKAGNARVMRTRLEGIEAV
jgi:hypothetical protein